MSPPPQKKLTELISVWMTDLLYADRSDLWVQGRGSAQCRLLLPLFLQPNLTHELGPESSLPRSLMDLNQPDCFLQAHLNVLLNTTISKSEYFVDGTNSA